MSMVLTRNMCRQMTWELSTTCFFCVCAAIFGFCLQMTWDYVTCLVAYDQVMCSCTTAAQGRNQKKRNRFCCLRQKSTWDEFSTLSRECSWWNDSEPLAEPLNLILHSWELMSCALGPGCRHHKVNRGQTSLQYQFRRSCVFSWELMSCALGPGCRHHKVNRGQNQLTISISTFPCLQLRAHIMCSGGLVWKPQGEQGSKPAFKSQFLRSRVFSCVMYSGGLVSSPQGELWSKPLYNCDFIYVFPDFFFVCLQSCLKARSSIKTHRTRKLPKRNPRGGDGRRERERGFSRPHLFLYSISRRHEVSPPTSSF